MLNVQHICIVVQHSQGVLSFCYATLTWGCACCTARSGCTIQPFVQYIHGVVLVVPRTPGGLYKPLYSTYMGLRLLYRALRVDYTSPCTVHTQGCACCTAHSGWTIQALVQYIHGVALVVPRTPGGLYKPLYSTYTGLRLLYRALRVDYTSPCTVHTQGCACCTAHSGWTIQMPCM
ncbi:ketol-acid reductoisomerase [Filimonas zeae]|nr:ketol-acid reductoisomerase [Filimonas zeae]